MERKEEAGAHIRIPDNQTSQASNRVRYFLDEHIDPGVVPYLRSHGIDVLTALEAGRANQRISDADQLTYAYELIPHGTLDDD